MARSSPRNEAITLSGVRRKGAVGEISPPASESRRRSRSGFRCRTSTDVVPGPGPSLDEFEALEAVERSDAARLPFELESGPQRPLPTHPEQLQPPPLLEPKRLEQLDLLVLDEEARGDHTEEGEVLGPEFERDRLHADRALQVPC